MSVAARLLALADRVVEPRTVHAHCDIPCGVYDPEQARIEAESCYMILKKYHDSDDAVFRARCLQVKENRADLAKHHLYVLWSDYFKPHHLEQYPDLHDTFWQATKQVTKVKGGVELDDAQKLLDMIDEIDEMWKKTGGLDSTRVAGRPGN